jgi:hypothetical protein
LFVRNDRFGLLQTAIFPTFLNPFKDVEEADLKIWMPAKDPPDDSNILEA